MERQDFWSFGGWVEWRDYWTLGALVVVFVAGNVWPGRLGQFVALSFFILAMVLSSDWKRGPSPDEKQDPSTGSLGSLQVEPHDTEVETGTASEENE